MSTSEAVPIMTFEEGTYVLINSESTIVINNEFLENYREILDKGYGRLKILDSHVYIEEGIDEIKESRLGAKCFHQKYKDKK